MKKIIVIGILCLLFSPTIFADCLIAYFLNFTQNANPPIPDDYNLTLEIKNMNNDQILTQWDTPYTYGYVKNQSVNQYVSAPEPDSQHVYKIKVIFSKGTDMRNFISTKNITICGSPTAPTFYFIKDFTPI